MPKAYTVRNETTLSVFRTACRDCSAHAFIECACPSLPTTPAAVSTHTSIATVNRQQGVVRVIASDAKNAVNNTCIRAYVGTVAVVRSIANVIKNIVVSAGEAARWYFNHLPVMLCDMLAVAAMPTIIGIFFFTTWYVGFGNHYGKSPRERLIAWHERSVTKTKAYIQSVKQRAREEIK